MKNRDAAFRRNQSVKHRDSFPARDRDREGFRKGYQTRHEAIAEQLAADVAAYDAAQDKDTFTPSPRMERELSNFLNLTV